MRRRLTFGGISRSLPRKNMWSVLSDLVAVSVWNPVVANLYNSSADKEGVGVGRSYLPAECPRFGQLCALSVRPLFSPTDRTQPRVIVDNQGGFGPRVISLEVTAPCALVKGILNIEPCRVAERAGKQRNFFRSRSGIAPFLRSSRGVSATRGVCCRRQVQ